MATNGMRQGGDSSYRIALVGSPPVPAVAWARRRLQPARSLRTRLLDDPPHAIIIDLATAGRGDLEFAWRTHDDLNLPLIVLWPGAPSDDVVQLLQRGAEDVITESLGGDAIAARVAAIIRRTVQSRRPLSRRVTWGETSVDLDSRIVTSPAAASRSRAPSMPCWSRFCAATGERAISRSSSPPSGGARPAVRRTA